MALLPPSQTRAFLRPCVRERAWALLWTMGAWIVGAWIMGACLVSADRAQAQPRVTSPYSVDFFATEAGLPGHHVFDIEQTPDGYLWVATNSGLARFDGHRFVTAGSLLPDDPGPSLTTALHRGAADSLLINAATDVLRYARGRSERIGVLSESMQSFTSLAQDRTGQVWGVTGTSQLYRLTDGQFDEAPYRIQAPLGGEDLLTDANGDVWGVYGFPATQAGTAADPAAARCWRAASDTPQSGHALARLTPTRPDLGHPTAFPFIIPRPAQREALAATIDAGTVSLFTPAGGARGRYTLPASACPLLVDRTGALWMKDGAALVAYAPDAPAPHARLDLGLRTFGLPPVFEDREGTLWIGTQTQGLVRVRPQLFRVYTTTPIAADAPLQSIVPGADGSVLLIDNAQRVVRAAEDRLAPAMLGSTPLITNGLYEAESRQRLFQDPQRFDGLRVPLNFFRERNGQVENFAQIAREPGYVIDEFYPDPRDREIVWAYGGNTVHRLLDPFGLAPQVALVRDSLSNVRHLLRDRSGTMWIATQGGLVRLDGDTANPFTTADGLPDNHVRYVHEDAEGVLWVGTYGGGLVRYKNERFQTVSAADGLAEDIVSAILEDDAGQFWMSGNRGIHRASRAHLNAFLDGEASSVPSVRYGRESGILNPETSGAPALKAADGRLWFPTFNGAAVVDPSDALRLGQEPPLVQAEQVVAGDDVFVTELGGPIRLAADQRRFAIDYVGLSLRHPEHVTYRYRLDGLDADWVEAGTERRAAYTNVPPGTHTFRVEARTLTGVWSAEPATLTLQIAPFFYETLWFRLACALGALSLLVGLGRARAQRAQARERALNTLVQQRTRALEREKQTVAVQAEALRALDRAKSNFFANISHEFRTPLTLIIGPLEDVQEGLHGPVAAPVAQQTEVALSNGRRLLKLVNQLLDVARLESGKERLAARPLAARAALEQAVLPFAPLAERRSIVLEMDLHVSPELTLWADPDQLEKVVGNLLSNALKFTPKGGAVRVAAYADATQPRADTEPVAGAASSLGDDHASEGHLVLHVEDSGVGIAPDHLPYVFERFYQADGSSTRHHAGTGIGLALVKHLVELHQGTVEVTSTLGTGTTFTVRLPLGRAHLTDRDLAQDALASEDRATGDRASEDRASEDRAAGDGALLTSVPHRGIDAPVLSEDQERLDVHDAPVADAASTEAHAKTVLIVDDNAEVRRYVRQHLARRFRVVEAADGQQALDRARVLVPDLIVSDVMMPNLDGIGLCRALRADPDLAFLPLVLLTAKAEVQDKLDGLQQGADDYLTKPFNVRELEVRVENLIVSRQRLRDHYASGTTPSEPVSLRAFIAEEALTDDQAALLNEVRTTIEARLADEEFGVDALAEAVGLGRSSLYRHLSGVLTCSPMELIWHLRLERAATLLRTERGTVSEVAYAAGFKNVGHFCTRFKEAFGQTPAAYAEASASEDEA